MSPILIIFTQLLVHQVFGDNTEENLEGCKRAFTLGYGYKTTYHIQEDGEHSDNQLILRFYVKTLSDAHVLLTSEENITNTDSSYEIVFGAGTNSFTDIRNKGSNKAHITTPNIVSSTEFRGFWIKVTSPGHIEIGKAGSEAPLAFWDDPHPIKIRYFAFSSWNFYIGQWYYSCPHDSQAEVVSTNLTKLERLRKDLLTHYDPFNRPVIQAGDVTTVYLQLQNRAVRLEEKKSKMSIVADVHLQWQDKKLQWNPQRNANISKLTMAYHEIWQPDLMLYNAVGSGTGILADEPMTVSVAGSVRWRTHVNVEVHCNLDLSEWPYDKQVCELFLGFWAEQKYLKLLHSTEPEYGPQQTNSEWQIIKLQYENVHIKTPWTNETDIPKDAVMAIRYVLQRSNYMYRAVFGVPLLVISIITLLPFWISPMNPIKLHISCLSLIIMSIFVVSLGKILPAPSDHIPVLVQTYSRGMVAISFSVLISVAVITIARSTHIRHVPQTIQNLMNGKYMQFILLFPAMSNKDASEYGNLLEADSAGSQAKGLHTAPDNNDIQQQWVFLAQIIDRVSFMIYTIYLSAVFLGQLTHM